MKSNKFYRLTAAALALSFLSTSVAQAAAPQVETDETVYINLDYYGNHVDTRIVKGVNLNGHQQFTDYGNYRDVYNMSTFDEPDRSAEGTVKWNLKDNTVQRFYYECIPDEENPLVLPWNFDVSYQLNGKSVTAEACAGASGLIEITIHATPNKLASEYYQNNMMLICATGIDMNETLSIDAPGAQIQSMGTYKIVGFMGLPGEEETFTIRIGSDNFESMGMFLLMAPATLSSLDIVADLRDAKDRLTDSNDKLSQGLSDVLDTMDSMKSGLDTLSGGIEGIDQARKQLIESRGQFDPAADAALAAIEALAGNQDSLIPALQKLNDVLPKLDETVSGMMETVQQTSTDLPVYQEQLQIVRQDLEVLRTWGQDFQENLRQDLQDAKLEPQDFSTLREAADQFSADLTAFTESGAPLRQDMEQLSSVIEQLNASLEGIVVITDTIDLIFDDIYEWDPVPGDILGELLEDLLRRLLHDMQITVENLRERWNVISEEVNTITDTLQLMLDELSGITAKDGSLSSMLAQAEAIGPDTGVLLQESIDTLETSVNDIIADVNDTIDDLSDQEDLPEGLTDDIQQLTLLLDNTLSGVEQLTDDVPALSGQLTMLTETCTALIDETGTVTASLRGSITQALDASAKALDTAKEILRSVRQQADHSAQQSIDGMLDVLQKAVQSENTGSLKSANDAIQQAIDDAEQDLEEETNLLNIDSAAELQSVTSLLNPAPSSLQFILRTKEISVEELEPPAENDEAVADEGVLARIKHIFQKLFDAISSVFASDA